MNGEALPVSEPAPEPEAAGTALLVWQGVAITIPAELDDLDPDVIEAFENGKAIGALRALVGSAEYDAARDEFSKKQGHRPKMRDIDQLVNLISEHFGFENAGE